MKILNWRQPLVVHRYAYAPPRCWTLQHRWTLIPPRRISVERTCWPCIRWCGTDGYQENGQCFCIGLSCLLLFIYYCFFVLFFLYKGCCFGALVVGLIGSRCIDLVVSSTASSASAWRQQEVFSIDEQLFGVIYLAFCLSCFTLRNIKK